MYPLVFGDNFLSSVKKLDRATAVKINNKLKVLQRDPFHATLQTKPLHGKLKGMYSVRVGREYRVLFQFLSTDEIILVDVGHRKDIYR